MEYQVPKWLDQLEAAYEKREKAPEISAEEMDYILETQHGVRFLETGPKKNFRTDEGTLESNFGVSRLDNAKFCVSCISKYYHGQPIVDQWVYSHDERGKWKQEMVEKYGDVFSQRYTLRNQFRGGLMTKVSASVELLAMFAKGVENTHLALELHNIYYELMDENGRKVTDLYNLCERIEEKLRYVRLYEQKAEQALELALAESRPAIITLGSSHNF